MRTLLLIFLGGREFFQGVWEKYVLDFQDFLHEKLERLVGVALLCWLLMWLLGMISRHILKLAERQSGTAGHYSQVRTLTSVIRATGLGVIIVLATLQILSVFGFNLGPLLTSAGVAGVAIGLAAQNIVKDCFNGFLILIEDQYNVGDVVTVAGVSGTVERSRCGGRRYGARRHAVHRAQLADHHGREPDAGLFPGHDQRVGGLFGQSG